MERCSCLADAVGVMLIATIIWIVCSSFEGSFLSFLSPVLDARTKPFLSTTTSLCGCATIRNKDD